MTPGAGMRRAQASAAGSLSLALAHGATGPTFWSTRPLGLFPVFPAGCCWLRFPAELLVLQGLG